LKKLESTLSATLTSFRQLAFRHFLQQCSYSCAKRPGDPFHVVDSDIAFAAFDSANVIPMEIGSFGEILLREFF
jgi:hypothetical protein